MENRDLYEKIIRHEGKDNQLFIACEELAELIQAVSKYRRKPTIENRAHLIEELADVQIVIDQIEIMAGISYGHELIEKKKEKIDRIKKRFEGGDL